MYNLPPVFPVKCTLSLHIKGILISKIYENGKFIILNWIDGYKSSCTGRTQSGLGKPSYYIVNQKPTKHLLSKAWYLILNTIYVKINILRFVHCILGRQK